MAKRVQIQSWRFKGGKKPENTVVVARPSKWGNPWTVAAYLDAGYKPESMADARRMCVEAFRQWMNGGSHWAFGQTQKGPPKDIDELRGKNLACYCPLDQPCHADVLLELVNKEPTP